MNLTQVVGLYNYWIVVFLMMTGFYIVLARQNLIKTVIGLNIFQTSVFLLYITMGKIDGGTAPIIPPAIAAQQNAHGNDHATDQLHGPEKLHGADQLHLLDDAHGSQAADQSAATDNVVIDHSAGGGEIADHTGHDHTGSAEYAEVFDHADLSSHAEEIIYSNPLPSVLMLTAIVVGIATTALALALIVRIREDYGTIEEDEILELDRAS